MSSIYTTSNDNVVVVDRPKLVTVTPVPSDIEISQHIVKNVGLLSMKDIAQQYVLI
jgi:hypothetical protein